MRVLVTGAAGFTGRHLVPALERMGLAPVASVADLADAQAVAAEVEAARPDALVHLAARAFVQSDDALGFYRVNQLGTLSLLDAMARVSPGARVLLAGSAQVYGDQSGGRLDEDRPFRPANHYAASKACMELSASLWSGRLDIVVARPFNYTGVGQEARYLVPKIVDHFRRRAAAIELGNLDVERDFGDVRSVVEAYAALVAGGAPAGAYNVATGRATSVRAILGALGDMTGHRVEVRVNPAFVRADDVPTLVGDAGKLRRALPGWAPRELSDTLGWMLSEGG